MVVHVIQDQDRDALEEQDQFLTQSTLPSTDLGKEYATSGSFSAVGPYSLSMAASRTGSTMPRCEGNNCTLSLALDDESKLA